MISVQNLSKYYGDFRALGPVSFKIAEGECIGFLGLNGAGKTTALRVLACDLRPSSGTVSIGKVDAIANPHELRKKIGFLPESPPLYSDLTVREYLVYAGKLRGMEKPLIQKRIPEVLAATHIDDVQNQVIGTLSHGYKQRVGVAQAIIHEPELLILDEPTRGLDPVQIVEMRKMVQELKKSHTILISSHILTEISHTCDRLLVLSSGKIRASGSEDVLSNDLSSLMRVAIHLSASEESGAAAQAQFASLLEPLSGIQKVELVSGQSDEKEVVLHVYCETDLRADICKVAIDGGLRVLSLYPLRDELESIFVNLVKGGSNESN